MSRGNIVALPDNAPEKGEIFRHYKGDLYRVHALALHANDEEWMVVYEAMYENPDAALFALSLREWQQTIEWNGAQMERFKQEASLLGQT